ncbi:hypothetical protein HJC23_009457 [Cyclotella cryptica]|uniref:Uncharacterized protein n=1 Tax=Cyclotella cryptica TaxID=29204 RepID=A0ABD3Q0N0_9STRA
MEFSFAEVQSAGQSARMYTNLEEGHSNFNSLSVVERYFDAWNRGDIPLALACLDVYYYDTQFPSRWRRRMIAWRDRFGL